MIFYKVRPEVPASIGKNSIIERHPGVPMKITKLHLVFEGWLGSDIMETSPVFYVTERLKEGLSGSTFSGISEFSLIEDVTKSDNFLELYPDKNLPKLFSIKITGVPHKDDFSIDKGYLIISDRAKQFLTGFNLGDSEIEEVQVSRDS
jgi:hypothetical protein